MADENVHVKLAMAEVLGLFLVGLIAILVGMYGLEVDDGTLGVILATSPWIGLGLLLCTFVAFWNENVLVTAAFGIFAVFLLSLSSVAMGGDATSGEIYMVFIGIALALVGWVSLGQPVKILPIFLFIAALAFIFLGIWFKEGSDYQSIVGVLWTIAGLLAMYMATAIAMLVVKGKPVLPLLIKA